MHSRASTAFFSSRGPSEWHDVDYLDQAASHRALTTSLAMALLIAVIDFSWARTNVSVLYIVPLLLLAQSGEMRYWGRMVGLLIALTFSAYLVKKMIDPLGPSQSYFHYSLLNRSLVAAMLLAVSCVLRVWIRWSEEQANPELPAELRTVDREVSETLAVALTAPLAVLIVLIDVFAPANFNLAILYPVPLLICVWTRSRRLLWTMLVVLITLALVAQWIGPPPTDPLAIPTQFRNRLIAGVAMVAVAFILHVWIGRKPD